MSVQPQAPAVLPLRKRPSLPTENNRNSFLFGIHSSYDEIFLLFVSMTETLNFMVWLIVY
jgi:hypothetical protein